MNPKIILLSALVACYSGSASGEASQNLSEEEEVIAETKPSGFSIRQTQGMSIPIGASSEFFNSGLSVGLSGEYRLRSIPLIYFRGSSKQPPFSDFFGNLFPGGKQNHHTLYTWPYAS